MFVSCCLGMLVDKLKYSVAMALLQLTGLSFSLRGQVILGSPKNNVFSVRDFWPLTYVHRY